MAAGATLIDEPRDQEYGERSSTVKDKAGNFWYIATAQGKSHVPKGLFSVNPYLHPRRAEPFIAFLKRAFGAQEVAKYASPDGVVHHAVVRVGDSVLEMGEAHGKYEHDGSHVLSVCAEHGGGLSAGAGGWSNIIPGADRSALRRSQRRGEGRVREQMVHRHACQGCELNKKREGQLALPLYRLNVTV